MEDSAGGAPCAICAAIGAYVEMAHAQDPDLDDGGQSLPPEAQALQAPNEGLAAYYRYKNERLLKCPQCGAYYWARTWAPGGSDDVMHTTIHHSLRRLGPLETHVELHDALYQSTRHAKEMGAFYRETHEAIATGVEAEMALLRGSAVEVVGEAIHSLEHRYRRSDELAEMLTSFRPQHDHTAQLAEARGRDDRVARYHAAILSEYLPACAPDALPDALIERMVALLAADGAEVRRILCDALLRLAVGGGRAAAAIVSAAAAQRGRSAEIDELLAAIGA